MNPYDQEHAPAATQPELLLHSDYVVTRLKDYRKTLDDTFPSCSLQSGNNR